MCPEETVRSVQEYIACVKRDTENWVLIPGCSPWFRGQGYAEKPPMPGILREGTGINERSITERFANLAPIFGTTPTRTMYDEWLYLMQHVGVPTRLLDWSEGALIGLYFAVQSATENVDPGVWLLHPLKLNEVTLGEEIFPDSKHPAFQSRCDLAFGQRKGAPRDCDLPIAIIPTYIHPRMRSQRGCFTLHGSRKANFEAIADESGLLKAGFFKKYRVPSESAVEILSDLRLLGITHSTLFPDHDGLAVDLKQAFKEKQAQSKSCGEQVESEDNAQPGPQPDGTASAAPRG